MAETTNNEVVSADVETMIRKFKKKAIKDELMIELKKRQFFMSKREKRKFKSDMAQRKLKNKKYR